MNPIPMMIVLFACRTAPGPQGHAVGADAAPAEVSYARLLDEMIDLNWLATRPQAGERGFQFSSYDRRSEAGPSDPEAWFANDDRGKYLGTKTIDGRTTYIMAECDGPGCVSRIWSANPDGNLLFLIDDRPPLEIAFQDLCSGKKPPFIAPLSGEQSRGWNCYVPIPFREHLQILATKNTFYYHVNIRRFSDGTQVPSFSMDLMAAYENRLRRVARVLEDRSLYPPAGETARNIRRTLVTRPTSSARAQTLLDLEGPGIVRRLTLRPEVGDLGRFLREARLVIKADGEKSVDCPLGDFFGTAPDWTPYRALPLGITEDGTGYCQFPMPFAKKLEVGLVNEGDQDARLDLGAIFQKGDVADYPLRFHAGWAAARNLSTRPRRDYEMLNVSGQGRFVGCSLMVANPVRGWWGEGDEHFWVDGETFPSTFGTGTEDYFGYAWCCPETFEHSYHNQPRCDGPGNWGYTSVNRFQILDSVPYRSSFRFDLEVWHWAECRIDLASTAYWYAMPGGSDSFSGVPPADRVARVLEPLKIKRVKGALEGEKLRILEVSGGKTGTQNMAGFGPAWSSEAQLWWTQAHQGDTLDLRVPVSRQGLYDLRAQFTRAADYGVVRVSLGETPLGEPIDLYHDGVVATGEIDLGKIELAPPAATLRLTITGANPKAVKRYMVGLDYLRLIPADQP